MGTAPVGRKSCRLSNLWLGEGKGKGGFKGVFIC